MWEIFVMMWQLCILIVVSVTQIHKCNKIEQNHTHVKLVHSEFCGSYNLYFLVLISCYIYVGFTIRRAVHRTSLYYFFSVQFSRSVVSDSLQIHGLQHARLPCPSSISGATQTHVHRVGDAIQPSPLLSSPSPPAFNLSQHQGLFQWASFSHQVTKVLELASASVLPVNIQDWSPLGWTRWISLQSKGLSRVFNTTTVLNSAFSFLYGPTLTFIHAAAAAKSLQSWPTLCDPIDGSPPDSPIPGILLARILEWVAIPFSNEWKWKVKVKLLSHAWLLATPWTAAYQAPLSMGFSRQEYWSVLPLLSPIHTWLLEKP